MKEQYCKVIRELCLFLALLLGHAGECTGSSEANWTINKAPVFDHCSSITATVPEGAAFGYSVINITATDNDPAVDNEIEYSQVPKYHQQPQLFDLRQHTDDDGFTSAELVTTAIFDREGPVEGAVVNGTRVRYRVTVQATDRGAPPLSATCFFFVDITDVNDNAPVFDSSSYRARILRDHFNISAPVTRVFATDDDAGQNSFIVYKISEESQCRGCFVIDGETGVIRTLGTGISQTTEAVTIQVKAEDRPLTGTPKWATANVVIEITDDNSTLPPTWLTTEDGLPLDELTDVTIEENATKNTELDVYPSAQGVGNYTLELVLKQGRTRFQNSDGDFTYRVRDSETVMRLRVKNKLNNAVTPTYSLKVYTRYLSGPTAVSTDARIPVRVIDVNDHSPVFEGLDASGNYPAAVSEQTGVGEAVVAVTAVDYDGTFPNNQVIYQFADNCGSDCDGFQIDEGSGVIYAMSEGYDPNTKLRYELLVEARDGAPSVLRLDGQPNKSYQTVIVHVIDPTQNTPSDLVADPKPTGQLLPTATRQCIGNLSTGAHWGKVQREESCSELPSTSAATQELKQLDESEVNDENVNQVAGSLEALTNNPEILTHTDIALGAHILEKLTQVNQTGREVGVHVVATVNNLLKANSRNMAYAERTNCSATRVIKSLEKYSLTADLNGNQTLLIQSDQITLEMWDLGNMNSGISGFGHQGKDKLKPVHYESLDEVDFTETETAIIMSDVVKQQLQEFYDDLEEPTNDKIRLAFTLYSSPDLFLTPQQLDFPGHPSAVNSEIVSLTVHLLHQMELKGQIWVIFRPREDRDGNITCEYWDFHAADGRGDWSTRGCSLNTTKGGRVLCQCNHLTNFAILMDPEAKLSKEHKTALSVITYLGLGLSTVGLLLTLSSFVIFRGKLRWGHGQKVLVNLAVALLSVNMVFMVGIERTEDRDVCVAVAALLHYLLLVAFAWMLVEAVLQYLRLVKVIGVHVERFMLKTALPSWTLPAILVIVMLCIDYFSDHKMYRDSQDYCWLTDKPLYLAFMLPVGLIILINTVLYTLIIKSITCDRAENLRSTQSKSDLTRLQVCCSLSIFVLLGMTWVFGFLTITKAGIVFHYVFSILNSFQGFLIFVFHTFRDKQARELWYGLVCPSKHQGHGTAKTKQKYVLCEKQKIPSDSTLGTRSKTHTETL